MVTAVLQTTFWMHFSEWKYINFYIKYAYNFFVIHIAVITLVAMSPERVYVNSILSESHENNTNSEPSA